MGIDEPSKILYTTFNITIYHHHITIQYATIAKKTKNRNKKKKPEEVSFADAPQKQYPHLNHFKEHTDE